jgi:hypothetical protein
LEREGCCNTVFWTFGGCIKTDASVKSTLPPRFWGVGIVFATFFGLLTVASKLCIFADFSVFLFFTQTLINMAIDI